MPSLRHTFAHGGYAVLRGLLTDAAVRSLAAEAYERRADARREELYGSFADDWRGGAPARACYSSPAGSAQWNLFGTSAAAATLAAICGGEVRTIGGGTYSYYWEAGDFLALHRDIRRCDVSLLTCLEDTRRHGTAGGVLRIYPDYASLPLSQLRREPQPRFFDAELAVGDSALIFGGIVPHEVTPMVDGQRRTMSVMCFEVAPTP